MPLPGAAGTLGPGRTGPPGLGSQLGHKCLRFRAEHDRLTDTLPPASVPGRGKRTVGSRHRTSGWRSSGDLAGYGCWRSQGAVVRRARGTRRRGASSSRRWIAAAAVVVIASACVVTGLVQWAGAAGTKAPAAVAGSQVDATRKAGGHTSRPDITGAHVAPGGAPEAGLTAVAAGPVTPSVVSALSRARHFPRPATSSAAGRFNVGQPHSPELLRRLSGGQDKGAPSNGARAARPAAR